MIFKGAFSFNDICQIGYIQSLHRMHVFNNILVKMIKIMITMSSAFTRGRDFIMNHY